MPEMVRDRATQKLLSVIQVMREACDDAERAARRDDATDLLKCQRVLHAFAWGFANASTGIESAMSHIDGWIGIDVRNEQPAAVRAKAQAGEGAGADGKGGA